ncbi:hypothetical protein GCM10014715_84280 [Streptomyces spiralis]|uniref:Uncharacterized protein n=1 Tax=Streptomyces spiralis TaxID=66376 RepID=A0A919ANA7_9ACTN|nr:hypothetical protein [Streptomyces spiralis]GHF16146.1 hypothetical protein GCM10014715_84280 [Streptomyces spiralis]
MELAELFQALFARSDGEDLVPLMPQAQSKGLTNVLVIFDKQNSWHFGSLSKSGWGDRPAQSAARQPLQNDHSGSKVGRGPPKTP